MYFPYEYVSGGSEKDAFFRMARTGLVAGCGNSDFLRRVPTKKDFFA